VRRHPSLLRLLVFWQASVLTVTLSILSVAILLIVTYRLRRHHDDELVSACRRAAAVVTSFEGGVDALRATLAEQGLDVAVEPTTDAGGDVGSDPESVVVELSNARPLEDAHELHDSEAEVADRVGRCRIRSPDGTVHRIEAREQLGDLASTIESLQWIILIVAPMVLVLAISAGAVILRRSLGPLRQVVQWARSVDADHLNSRIVVARGPSDINVLVDTFNQMIERLATSFERLQQFTANASHELRTPLTSLTSSLEVSLQRPRAAEEYRRVMEQSLSEVRRLNTIVEHLLTVARTDSERVQLRPEPLSLGALLLESLEAIDLRALAAGVDLELDEIEDLDFVGDPHWLRQLFDNLVDNAVKYTPSGGSVVVSAEFGERDVRVSVTDTGIGIPSDQLDRIFGRYERLEADDRPSVAGVGLGLSIAEWVAQAHGGWIEVESELGRGTRFIVVLSRGPSREPN